MHLFHSVSCAQSAAAEKEFLQSGTKKPKNDSHSSSGNKKPKASTTAGYHLQRKSKCLDLSQRVAVLKFVKERPDLGSRKIADHFGTGKMEI